MVQVKTDMTGWVMAEHGVPDSRWIVVERAEDYTKPDGVREAKWWCRCSCGNPNLKSILGRILRFGGSLSCGCLQREKAAITCSSMKKNTTWIDDIFEDEKGQYRIGLAHNTGNEFYVDVEDFEKVKDYCWTESVSNMGLHFPVTTINGKTTSMHQLLGCKNWDHADRNEMNNRRCNLRPCTVQENRRNKSTQSNNTSGVSGVSWRKDREVITVENRKQIHLGVFKNKEDAIRTRLNAENEMFKEFAPQKDLFESYGIISYGKQDDVNTKQND